MIGIRCLLRFKTTDSKKNLGIVFKKMNRDTKVLFGDLLETHETRKKRLKLIEKRWGEKEGKENNYLSQLKSTIRSAITKGTYIYYC